MSDEQVVTRAIECPEGTVGYCTAAFWAESWYAYELLRSDTADHSVGQDYGRCFEVPGDPLDVDRPFVTIHSPQSAPPGASHPVGGAVAAMSDGAGVSGGREAGPSEKAVEAAERVLRERQPQLNVTYPFDEEAAEALDAAHDPRLGEDMSVSLRAVLDVLRGDWDTEDPMGQCEHPAAFLLRSFTEDSA